MSLLAVTLACLSIVGQHHKPVADDHLEEAGDPPALFKPMGRSSRLIVPYNGFTSFQVNVDGNQQNIIGDAANEPSICVDPTNPSRIAIGWRQFDSVASNFRQAGYAYTTDGGLTWHFPGRLENNVFRSDPVLAARYDGSFFYLSLLNSFYDDIWGSSDGGGSWSRIASADGGDKQWFTIDNGTSSGRGFIYQDWSTAGNNWGGRQFTRSTDGGMTWLNPINIPNRPVWGTLDVDGAGNLYLGGWANNFRILRSSNAKNGTVTPTFDINTVVNLGGSIDSGSIVNPGGLSGQMWVIADRSSTASPQPIYGLCSVYVNSSNPCDVMLARSTNGGSSYSSPIRINDDATNSGNYHWFGTLAVGPTGRLDTVWNDTRDDSSHQTSSLYYAYSLDGGAHFSQNIRVSPSWNQSVGYPNQDKMGDYLGVVSNAQGANIAFAATFNNEQDVYYMLIPPVAVVAPTSLAVQGGGPFLGNVNSLGAIDGDVLTLTGTFSNSYGQVQDATIEAQSPSSSPKAMLFNLVGQTTYAGTTARISFYNWSTSQYEVIRTVALGASNTYANVLASGDPSRFVSASGRLRAQIRCVSPNQLHSNWVNRFDQAVWHVIP